MRRRKRMPLLSSRRIRRVAPASESHLSPWEGDGASNPGNSFEIHEGQELASPHLSMYLLSTVEGYQIGKSCSPL